VLTTTRRAALRFRLTSTILAVFLALGTGAFMAAPDPAPALVAAYSFNEGSGSTLTDVSGSGNHGELLNGPSWTSDGKHGGALAFDGIDDLVSIADAASLDLATGMTLEAWVRPARWSDWGVILAKGADSPKKTDADPVYALRARGDHDRAEFALRVGDRTYEVKGEPKRAAGGWVHVAATHDGSVARVYVNGVQVAFREAPGAVVSSTRSLRIGSDAGSKDRFRGTIDDLRIYNAALTRAQIQADMQAPVEGAVPDPPEPSDTEAPAVALSAPGDGSTLSGMATLAADATDNVGVASVQFLRDGAPLGAADVSAPFDLEWDTATAPNGVFAIAARAVDAAGNATTSGAVAVWVNNAPAPAPVVELGSLNGHTVFGDSSLQIVSWLGPQHAAYDQALAIAWDFLLNRVPNDSNGLKAYFTNSYLEKDSLWPSGWMHNPAHLYAAVIESALAYYGYSGDARVIALARSMADYHLANGLTPDGWEWARVPYASGCGNCPTYDGTGTLDTTGHTEPDKVGELGLSLIRLYEFTGDARYRDAALDAANALAAHVRPGSATQSPWPFRVNAQTNVAAEQYSANVIKPIALFDVLIRLNLGDVASYAAARLVALEWLLTYPMQNNVWSNYFEDVPIQADLGNFNQYIPMETAYYLMLHPEHDPDWRTHVPALVAWVESTFGDPQFGANAIKEQMVFHFAMGSHTSRYAAVNALYHELTGDAGAKAKAYRALNWATYMISDTPQGQIIDGPEVGNVWFTDGYGDYMRHFLRALGAVPEWAPEGQNHLTRFTSVVTAISYAPGEIAYTTADPDGIEVLKVAFLPREVRANGVPLAQRSDLTEPGWSFDGANGILRVRHAGARAIHVTGQPRGADTTPPAVSMTAPAAGSTVSGIAVAVEANASDEAGISSVQFLLDGAPLGAPDTTAPYSVSWNSTTAGNGDHTLAAIATDTAGHTTTSTAVNVTVDNLVQQVITFNDAPHSQPLSGEYPAGVAEWGADVWFLSPPWQLLTTNSISFNGPSATSASFTFLAPKRLISVTAFNGGATATTVTLGCGANAAVEVTLAPNELLTIQTGWVESCSAVTIGSSNGWDTNFGLGRREDQPA
jgi:hypothetical protein